MLSALKKLQTATLECRDRTNDYAIGTQANNGQIRVIRFLPDDSIVPVSDWMSPNSAVKYLNAMREQPTCAS